MFMKLLVGVSAAAAGLLAAGLLAIAQGGVATVWIHNEDVTLFLPVPMVLADVAVSLAPEGELAQARRELAPYRGLVRAALEGLAECPDAVFVDIQGPSESVLISKEGSALRVEIHSRHDGDVEIRVPLRAVQRAVAQVAG
ncbi:MAG: hypothetical protein Kow001_25900 [Acidobacteriota bacterium]